MVMKMELYQEVGLCCGIMGEGMERAELHLTTGSKRNNIIIMPLFPCLTWVLLKTSRSS